MNNQLVSNVGMYLLMPVTIAVLTILAQQLTATGPIDWRLVLAAGLGALATALGAMQLPRAGSERLAAQIDGLRKDGLSRKDMIVVPKEAGPFRPSEGIGTHPVPQRWKEN